MGELLQCRSTTVPKMKKCSTVPKMKILFNSADNLNNFHHIKCSNQQLNSDRLKSLQHTRFAAKTFAAYAFWQHTRFGAKTIV